MHNNLLFRYLKGELCILILLLFSGCGSGNKEEPTPQAAITISTSSQEAFTSGVIFSGESSGSKTVSFTTTLDWTALISDTRATNGWLNVLPDQGKAGAATVSINVSPNDTYSDRSATITFRSGTATKSLTVKQSGKAVSPVESVTLDPASISLEIEGTAILKATITPEDATDKTITWSSTKPEIASVDNNGKVTAIAGGNTTITAKAGEKEATCKVTVTVPVESIVLDRTEITLEEGQTTTLVATVNPKSATDKSVTWSTTNASAALIDTKGLVTAVAEGTAIITAQAGSKEARCLVTVNKKTIPIETITLNKTEITLKSGQTFQLTASITPADATDKTIDWSTSNATFGIVDTNGIVKALKEGSVIIVATSRDGNTSASCTVIIDDSSTGDHEGTGTETWD